MPISSNSFASLPLLFLFTVEERGLLHAPDESAEAREARNIYAKGYALRRLRIARSGVRV